MRDYSHHIELNRQAATEKLLACVGDGLAFGAADAIERVPVAEAFGRVLAADVRSAVQAPNTLTCSLDSIAVHWEDFENGMPDTSGWVRGIDWQFANTGVAMPEGFDTAMVIEYVDVSADEQHVVLHNAPSRKGAGTRPAGDRLQVGDLLAPAGRAITPDLAARIVSGNHTTVEVVRKPKVAFIPTGNELVVAGSAFVERGKNLETNSIVVRGKVEQWGGEYVPFDIVPDSPALIEAALRQACAVADIVVLNAGSSKGSDDWSVEQMEDMGTILYHQTNHGPGHHSSAAVIDGTPVVGISGPAGGASFTLDFYLRPLMRKFLGQDPKPECIPARLMEDFPSEGHHAHGKKLAGEKRPREATAPGSEFFGVRKVALAYGPDGVLRATPVAGKPGDGIPGTFEGLTMVPTGGGAAPLKAGAMILVELV